MPTEPVRGLVHPSWYPQSVGFLRAALIAVDIATVGLLVWKFVTGTPPRRRALAVGAPIAICYLLAQATYQTAQLVNAEFGGATSQNLNGPLQWVIAGFRAAPWYGFLFSLIAAELFAARVLRDVVRRSMGRPPLRELEAILREPLGDPGLRLGFWRASTGDRVGRDGAVLEPPKPGQVLTEGAREGSPAVAIVHDAQLSEDPELLQAAGAAALLAQENAELDDAWKRSLRELADSRDKLVESRARLVRASDRERRRLQRDLHDGAQQRLMAVQIKLGRIEERVVDGNLAADLNAISSETAAAVEELRALAHCIYPPALRLFGLVDALRAFAMTAPIPIRIVENGVGRCSRPSRQRSTSAPRRPCRTPPNTPAPTHA